jgi:hypothetical protein
MATRPACSILLARISAQNRSRMPRRDRELGVQDLQRRARPLRWVAAYRRHPPTPRRKSSRHLLLTVRPTRAFARFLVLLTAQA